MKELMLSVRPEHLVHILNGDKTLELRKRVPKDFEGWTYLYATKNNDNLIYNGREHTIEKGKRSDYNLNGKVVARFWFDEYGELIFNLTHWRFEYNAWGEDVSKDLCLTTNEIMSYRANKNITLKNEKGIFYYPSKNKNPTIFGELNDLKSLIHQKN